MVTSRGVREQREIYYNQHMTNLRETHVTSVLTNVITRVIASDMGEARTKLMIETSISVFARRTIHE